MFFYLKYSLRIWPPQKAHSNSYLLRGEKSQNKTRRKSLQSKVVEEDRIRELPSVQALGHAVQWYSSNPLAMNKFLLSLHCTNCEKAHAVSIIIIQTNKQRRSRKDWKEQKYTSRQSNPGMKLIFIMEGLPAEGPQSWHGYFIQGAIV